MFLKAIISGIIATACMTLFLYLLDFIYKRRLKVVKVLGTMLTNETTPNGGLSGKPSVIAVGIAGHYAVGILFSLIYLGMMLLGFVTVNYFHGIIYGIFAGIIGVIVWAIYMHIHINPPVMVLNSFYIAIFWGHIIFGISLIFSYHLVSGLFN